MLCHHGIRRCFGPQLWLRVHAWPWTMLLGWVSPPRRRRSHARSLSLRCTPPSPLRSMQAGQWLLKEGFTNVRNVSGGIAAYSRVDPNVPEY